eukprot:CAMPEP_0184551322 /NCGR_PEP_ID=MMETSP0199_2-20130426/24571_1 /TAXON_ID=1112570 /ORGANISM="Thraustochytrium sp., Strain LLF1b" /LENGTH=69 /DNA_ID=CAMNT_0026946451 /DNA_START=422 /DNA_END=631 /DNA_ORIENTATION=-
MSFGGRDIKSLVDEVKQLEQELKLIKAGQNTRERCNEITKYVKQNEGADPLVTKTLTVFTQAKNKGCCM